MTSPAEMALDHQMAAQDGEEMPEHSPGPAGPLPAGGPQPAAGGDWYPGASAAGGPAEEPEVTGRDDAERSMTSAVPDAEPESIPESATAAAAMSTRWHEVQAMFVDDPRACAEMAAGLVDDSIRALVAFAEEQQDAMLATWHGEDAGTEELRTAVQHYRAFGTRLADFSRQN